LDELPALVERITATPAFRAAEQTPQDPERHPEGSVGAHLRLVLDAALRLADRNRLTDQERLTLAVVALTHDLGKADAHQRSQGADVRGHESDSVRILEAMAPALAEPVRRTALEIVELHDRGIALRHSRPEPGARAFRRLAGRLTAPTLYALFTIADRLGSRGDLDIPIWLIGRLRDAGADIPPLHLPDGAIV
jgi:tRNA nucleotidyltransferase (CCA-adding enzyme)